jgi:hypothetical protein
MNYFQNAALGVHGAVVLLSGMLENAITWETDSVTEDYWFFLEVRNVSLQSLDMPLVLTFGARH